MQQITFQDTQGIFTAIYKIKIKSNVVKKHCYVYEHFDAKKIEDSQ